MIFIMNCAAFFHIVLTVYLSICIEGWVDDTVDMWISVYYRQIYYSSL